MINKYPKILESNDYAICPHCNKPQRYLSERSYDGEYKCKDCNQLFELEIEEEIIYTYLTTQIFPEPSEEEQLRLQLIEDLKPIPGQISIFDNGN